MIINIGQRTDIPAFYSDWFYERVKDGMVMARNPFNPHQITEYKLDPSVVDCLVFTTKNPAPMLGRISEISKFRQLWHVTITPYGKDIEPYVPPPEKVVEAVKELSRALGPDHVVWRYDPILFYGKYTEDFHVKAFEKLAASLRGYTRECVISFIDLYQKTTLKFPDIDRVPHEAQYRLARELSAIGRRNGIHLSACLEDPRLSAFGVDTSGCMTKEKIEKALGVTLRVPKGEAQPVRNGCQCLLGHDIGAYDSCLHGCRYCYANGDRKTVEETAALHDDHSPLLIGHAEPGDKITKAKQESFIDQELSLF